MPHPDDMTLADLCEDQQRELDRLRAEVAELNGPSALGNLLQERNRLRSALDAIRRHSGKDTDAHQLAFEALEATTPPGKEE